MDILQSDKKEIYKTRSRRFDSGYVHYDGIEISDNSSQEIVSGEEQSEELVKWWYCALAPAATMTMTGTISDNMCGASHAKMMEEHKNIKTDHQCTLGCVKGGGKYVFISDGKTYAVNNQDMASLSKYAGEKVSLRGDMSGDTVTVSKISPNK